MGVTGVTGVMGGRDRMQEAATWRCRGHEHAIRREMVRLKSFVNATQRWCANDTKKRARLEMQIRLMQLAYAMAAEK